MKGDPAAIRHLNKILTGKLTAVNQYFLHARMLKDWGLERLADHSYQESISKMKHADRLIERILFLGGLPNVQRLNQVLVGESVEEILRADQKLEEKALGDLREGIAHAESVRDYVSRDLLLKILDDTEEHIDFLETQLQLFDTIGAQNYGQLNAKPADKAKTIVCTRLAGMPKASAASA